MICLGIIRGRHGLDNERRINAAMPIYEYQCEACGHKLEKLQKLSDDPLKLCPDCEKPEMKKLISAVAFRLKGSGWYETDFKTGDKKNVSSSDNASSASGGTSDSSGGSSDSSGGSSDASGGSSDASGGSSDASGGSSDASGGSSKSGGSDSPPKSSDSSSKSADSGSSKSGSSKNSYSGSKKKSSSGSS